MSIVARKNLDDPQRTLVALRATRRVPKTKVFTVNPKRYFAVPASFARSSGHCLITRVISSSSYAAGPSETTLRCGEGRHIPLDVRRRH